MTRRAQPLEVLSPVGGLDFSQAPTFIDGRATPRCKNVRLKQGAVWKGPGASYFGVTASTPLAGGHLTAIDQYYERDGDAELLAFSADLIYKYSTATENWNQQCGRSLVVADGESNWTASANVSSALDATDKQVGSNSVKLTIDAAFTTGLAAYLDFGAKDLSTYTYLRFWIKSDITTASGDLQILLDNTSACASPLDTLNVPALTAGTWKECVVALGSAAAAGVVSIGLQIAVDNGAQVVNIDDVYAVDLYTGSADSIWNGDEYLDDYFATNGTDAIQRKIGSANFDDWSDAVSAGYKAKIVRAYANHLVLFHTIESGLAQPQRVRWTDVGVRTLTGGTSGYADIDGSDHIVTAETLGHEVAIYKDDSIVMMSHDDSDVFHFDRKVVGTGLLAQKAIVNLDRFHIFLGTDNVYAYQGDSEPVPIGDKIRDDLFANIADNTVGRSFMIFDEVANEIRLYVPTGGSTYPNTLYLYNIKTKSWTKGSKSATAAGIYSTATALTFGTTTGTFGQQTITFGSRLLSPSAPIVLLGDSSGYVQRVDETTYDDLGSAVEAYYDTLDFTAHGLKDKLSRETDRYTDEVERWMRFAFDARGQAVSIYYSIDEGQTYTLLENITLDTGDFMRYATDLDLPADKVRFRFYNNSAASGFAVRYYAPWLLVRTRV